MNYLAAFGLTIRSSIDIPELRSIAATSPEVDIVMGDVPEHLESVIASGVMFEAAAEHFLIKLPPIARFLLSHGKQIVVQPCPGADPDAVRGLLLADVIPPLLRQRGVLVLHAAGIATSRGAVLFAGQSGAGKSTLVAELVRRGLQLVSDDFAAVQRDPQGQLVVNPGCGRIKLWRDSAAALDVATDELRRVRPGIDRFYLPMANKVITEPVPLAAVFLLGSHGESTIRVDRLDGQEAFKALRNQIRGLPAVERLRLDVVHFSDLAAIADRVPVFTLNRPRRPFDPGAVADRILELAGN